MVFRFLVILMLWSACRTSITTPQITHGADLVPTSLSQYLFSCLVAFTCYPLPIDSIFTPGASRLGFEACGVIFDARDQLTRRAGTVSCPSRATPGAPSSQTPSPKCRIIQHRGRVKVVRYVPIHHFLCVEKGCPLIQFKARP